MRLMLNKTAAGRAAYARGMVAAAGLSFFTVGAQGWMVQPNLSDEFNYPAGTAISPDKWNFMGNDNTAVEVQRRTNYQYNVPAGSHLTDYNLRTTDSTIQIVARKLSMGGYQYTSAGLNSQCAMAFTYGRTECRMKLPAAVQSGLWIDFNLMGNNTGTKPGCSPGPALAWPACGEVDIVQYWSQQPSVYSARGWCNTSCELTQYGTITPGNQAGVWRVYSCEKSPAAVKYWYRNDDDLEGTVRGLVTKSLSGCGCFDADMYYYLALNAGGGGVPQMLCAFPETLEVDYIRTYNQPTTAEPPARGRLKRSGDSRFSFEVLRSTVRLECPTAIRMNVALFDLNGVKTEQVADGLLGPGTQVFIRKNRSFAGIAIARVRYDGQTHGYRVFCP
jgi:hypothetical protein